MNNDTKITTPAAPAAARKGGRSKPYIDWFFGCILFSLFTLVTGLAFFNEFGDACFLCHEDIGWTLVVFAYATPGLAIGSVIWATMWMSRLWRGSQSDQFKPVFVVLLVSMVLLVANFHYFFAIPAAKNNLNLNPELTKSVVIVSTSINPYTHPDEPQGKSSGTGIVVDSERGWIVTNAHVARRVSSEISFQFSADVSEEHYRAKKLYVDPYLDLAVLEGPRAQFHSRVPSAPLDCKGRSKRKVGAMGYAGGERARFMIVKGERLGYGVRNGRTWLKAFADYHRGMSGGPTFDGESGRVVGINTMGTVGNLDYELGYAIPARYVCRVIDFLRKGQDPTPPHIPLTFFDNLSNKGKLVVAEIDPEIDRSVTEVSLFEGDTILGVEGVDGTVSSESDLVDVLRGVNYPINLRINRDGIERLVSVSFSRMERQSRRRLLYFAGFVIGESKPSNRYPNRAKQALMIRMADSSGVDDANPHDFDQYTTYIIMSVDGVVFEELESIHQYLSGAQRTAQKAVFKLREWRFRARTPYRYERLSIVPNDLKFIQ